MPCRLVASRIPSGAPQSRMRITGSNSSWPAASRGAALRCFTIASNSSMAMLSQHSLPLSLPAAAAAAADKLEHQS